MDEDITTAQAMKLLGVGDRQFRRICRAHGVLPSGERRVGRVRVHLYSAAAIAYLRAQAAPKEDERTSGQTLPDVIRPEYGPVLWYLMARASAAEARRDELEARVEALRQEKAELTAELRLRNRRRWWRWGRG